MQRVRDVVLRAEPVVLPEHLDAGMHAVGEQLVRRGVRNAVVWRSDLQLPVRNLFVLPERMRRVPHLRQRHMRRR